MKNVASIFKSLEDETRLRILSLLLQEDELCVCHFMEVFQLPQSTVSRHLATLKNAGWLQDRRRGVWIHYSISPHLSPAHKMLFQTLRTIMEKNEMAESDRTRLANIDLTTCCG